MRASKLVAEITRLMKEYGNLDTTIGEHEIDWGGCSVTHIWCDEDADEFVIE